MALKIKDLREMSHEEREEKLKELREELMHERGIAAMGGSPPSPGKIKQLRKSISRLLTLIMEEKGR